MNTHSEALANLENHLKVLSDRGQGRALLVLNEESAPRSAEVLCDVLAQSTRTLHVSVPTINAGNWEELAQHLRATLSHARIRQAGFVGFGAASVVIQRLALLDLKSVRTAVLVNSTTRAHPTRAQRVLDLIESRLPLGLPMRSSIVGFDSKPYLQRMRCPVLVVTDQHATAHELGEAKVFSRGLPTAWYANIDSARDCESLGQLILDFQEVPAKCPQRK